MVEEASGYGANEWREALDVEAPTRAELRLFDMCARRLRGEPLQYVLGAWSFRGLDLMVDRRVLIPRPETEWVVEVALEEAERIGLRRARRRPTFDAEIAATAVDLGTGSGAIALALEAELPDVEVWATDASADALAVASANIAGYGATRVRVAGAVVGSRRSRPGCGVVSRSIVSNPPYIAEHEVSDAAAGGRRLRAARRARRGRNRPRSARARHRVRTRMVGATCGARVRGRAASGRRRGRTRGRGRVPRRVRPARPHRSPARPRGASATRAVPGSVARNGRRTRRRCNDRALS